MIEKRVYSFKEEFCKELNIPSNQYDRKKKELLEWLTNFFDYDYLPGRPIRINIKEIYGEYQPLPRKVPKQDELNKQKKEDYEKFTITALGTEFKPNSKMRVAREAIESFSYEKYSHSSVEAVAKRYIKEPFEKYGETDNQKVWVYYSTYEKLNELEIEDWRNILSQEHIGEKEAACAFYKQEQGQDISEEKNYYQRAQEKFIKKYGDIPVLVQSWKAKKSTLRSTLIPSES